MSQPIGVVAVRVPQSDLVQPLPHLLTTVMSDFARIALIRQQSCQPFTRYGSDAPKLASFRFLR
jgi:hypothetical protein